MRYSQEFKDKTTARLLSKELTVPEASEQFKIAPLVGKISFATPPTSHGVAKHAIFAGVQR